MQSRLPAAERQPWPFCSGTDNPWLAALAASTDDDSAVVGGNPHHPLPKGSFGFSVVFNVVFLQRLFVAVSAVGVSVQKPEQGCWYGTGLRFWIDRHDLRGAVSYLHSLLEAAAAADEAEGVGVVRAREQVRDGVGRAVGSRCCTPMMREALVNELAAW